MKRAQALSFHSNQKAYSPIQVDLMQFPTSLNKQTSHTCQNGTNQDVVLDLDLVTSLSLSIKNLKVLLASIKKEPTPPWLKKSVSLMINCPTYQCPKFAILSQRMLRTTMT